MEAHGFSIWDARVHRSNLGTDVMIGAQDFRDIGFTSNGTSSGSGSWEKKSAICTRFQASSTRAGSTGWAGSRSPSARPTCYGAGYWDPSW
jgi:hypothetical protein